MIENPELWSALLPVIEAFESLRIPYHIGGSVASSFTGVGRATQDADLVADLQIQHAGQLVKALEGKYYADQERIAHGIRGRRSFNLIHLETMYKVDVFVLKDTPFARENMARRIQIEVPGLGRSFWFASPEDIVLHKLLWYAEGGGVSDRQWYDLQGVIRIQKNVLDRDYLRRWADRLEVSGLLQRALEEVEPQVDS